MATRKGVTSKVRTATPRWERARRRLQDSLNQRGLGLEDQPLPLDWHFGDIGNEWTYAVRRHIQNGRWIVAELRVFPSSELSSKRRCEHWLAEPEEITAPIPIGGLTARQLREVSFSAPHRAAMKGLLNAAREIARHYKKSYPKNDRLLAVVQVYVGCLSQGSRRPTAETAKELSIPISQVRDAIHGARKRGLLTLSRGQGYAGGELSPLAQNLLARRSMS